ncbi:hypothetical protein [Streptomyces sp. st140]|uniref:hypothetical protein n=1 Tax=Streptomyces sp. st140 TaxID=1828052 RepID=UPI00117BE3E2|nr:hypothetical protein [Streptomyces sp. st140]
MTKREVASLLIASVAAATVAGCGSQTRSGESTPEPFTTIIPVAAEDDGRSPDLSVRMGFVRSGLAKGQPCLEEEEGTWAFDERKEQHKCIEGRWVHVVQMPPE